MTPAQRSKKYRDNKKIKERMAVMSSDMIEKDSNEEIISTKEI